MISPIRPSTTANATSATRRTSGVAKGAKFSPATRSASGAQTSSAGQAQGVVASAPIASIDAVIALQAVDDPAGRKAKAVERGTRILDDLDDLKIALLEGRISADQLNRIISQMSARREQSGDHRLEDVLDGIDLRAQVELAKLGH